MIFLICTLIFLIQLGVILIWMLLPKRERSSNNEKISSFTVVVAFHNEEQRIQPLLEALNTSKMGTNVELLFIDDYSTDNSVRIIQNMLEVPYQIISNDGQRGKKYAIRKGMQVAHHDFVLTLDADVVFGEDYFDQLATLPVSDLTILSVQMSGKGFVQRLASVEFYFLRFLAHSSAKTGQPVIGYGANLMSNKAAFFEVDKTREDYKIVSGDDMFLLAEMRKHHRKIHLDFDRKKEVSTPAPEGFFALLKQRRRWLSKMGGLVDFQSGGALVLLVAVQCAFLLACWQGFSDPRFFGLIGVKLFSELIITRELWQKRPANIFFVCLHQLYYPLFLLMTFLPLRKEERWST